jgi:hypothetical protein
MIVPYFLDDLWPQVCLPLWVTPAYPTLPYLFRCLLPHNGAICFLQLC